MALAMLRAPPPSDLDVRLSEQYVSPTALYGHHPMYDRYYQWIKGHLETVDFGYTEVRSESEFTVKVPYTIRLDCVNTESFIFFQEVRVAMRILYEGGRMEVEAEGLFPLGSSCRELCSIFGAGSLASYCPFQDVVVDAEVFSDADAAETIARSPFVLDFEVYRGEPVALQD